MDKYIQFNEQIPHRGDYDIIVAGGGVAGIAAAVSGARDGKKVLLIEKSVKLGGLATLGLINYYEPLCNGRGKMIMTGMAEELLRLSIKYGYDTLPDEWRDSYPDGTTQKRYQTSYSADIFSLTLTELIINEGVEILFDTIVSTPVMTGNHCNGIIIDSKSGREYCSAKVIIDTTGDGDILYRAGVPTIQGKNYFSYFGKQITLDSCRKAADSGRIDHAYVGIAGGHSSLYGHGHPDGMRYFTGTTADDVTDYLIQNHLLVLDHLKDTDRWSREIVQLPGMAQFRTTRCIQGDYILQESDTYKHFDDSVGAICDFDRRDYLFEIPYRCLIRNGFDNIITAGRSAAGQGYAWDVLRVIPPAVASGQAAGLAASQAVSDNCRIDTLDVSKLQRTLENADVTIHFDDTLIPS